MKALAHINAPRISEQNINVLSQPLKHHAPFSQEAEEALLGALLLDCKSFPLVAPKLIAEDFFLNRHSYVYRAMERSYEEFKTFDYVTLSEFLENKGVLDEVGGQAFLIYLVNNTPSSVHVEVYAELVNRSAVRRRILMATDEMRVLAMNEDMPIGDVIAGCEKELAVSIHDYTKSQAKHWAEIIDDGMNRIIDPEKYKNAQQIEFPVAGFQFKLADQEQTVLMGLTGTGKTAFLLWLIKSILDRGEVVVFISMEMTKKKIMWRLVAQMTGIGVSDLETGNIPENKRADVIGALSICSSYADRFHIIENAHSPSEINREVASIAYTQDIALVAIDHLHRSKADNPKLSGYQVWEANATAFQEQAKKFNVPYLTLHQSKIPPPMRVDKTPYDIDMYGGTSVSNILDNVYAIHRDNHSALGLDAFVAGRVDIFELKNRNGGNNSRKLVGHLRYVGNEQYSEWTESNRHYLT